jgi:DNA polymerase-3 subunit delta'
MSELDEIDRLADTPHPRETQMLFGQDDAEQALLENYRSGRMHHAWILGGPEGVGKATLAYRMARFVFANPDPSRVGEAGSLATAPDQAAARMVTSQSHVDLVVLRRVWNEKSKTFFSNIRVDDVRDVVRFFGTTAGAGGWRIAIIDCAEDLATAGANALLKVLEEPPPRALFLIVSHQPARLLPTIRSRCRKLVMPGLEPPDLLKAACLARPDLEGAPLQGSLPLAQGSVRRAITLASGDGVKIHQSLSGLLARLPQIDVAAAHALADRCMGKGSEENFALLLSFLDDWLHQRLLAEQNAPGHRLARWAEVWDKSRSAARDVEAYNLDRKPFVLSTLSMLAQASRA